MKNKLLLLLCVLLLQGCATPMVASLKKHKEHYIPTNNPDKGLVYIYREGEYVGCLRGVYVDINDKRVGALNSGTYFVYESDPGKIVVSIEDWLGKNPSRNIDVIKGESYYVKGGIKMGLWDADPYISVVSKEEGAGAIQELVYATMKEKDLDNYNKKTETK